MDKWIKRIVIPKRYEKRKEHQGEEEFPALSTDEENDAKDERKAARIKSFKPALCHPIFFHIQKITVGIGKKEQENILGGKTPCRCFLIGNSASPDGMMK